SMVNVLNAQANYRSDLDQLKQQLGLPMNLNLELDDELLRPLIDQTRRYEDISTQFEQVSNAALQYAKPTEVELLRARLTRLFTDSPFVRGTRFADTIRARLATWEKLGNVPMGPLGRTALDEEVDRLRRQRRELREKRDELRDKEKGDLSAEEKE